MNKGNLILRFGLSAVFLYFSIYQFIDPAPFTSYLPTFLQGSHANTLVYMNATLDAVLAVCMLLSIFPRIAPVIAAVHLMGIALSMGFDDVAVRDIGLGIACLSLAFWPQETPLWRQILKR